MGRRSGFFIRHLTDRLSERFIPPDDTSATEAGRWIHPAMLELSFAQQVRAEVRAGGRIPHVCLTGPLVKERAEAIHGALAQASFTRHKHEDYPVWLALRHDQVESPLTDFYDWLKTRDAAEFHRWLVGYPERPFGADLVTQCTVSEMRPGDSLPVHVDAGRQSLSVVYQLSRGWSREMGGVLHFPRPDGTSSEIEVVPSFNSVLIFVSTPGTTHGVTPVTQVAGEMRRNALTVFYVEGGEVTPGAN